MVVVAVIDIAVADTSHPNRLVQRVEVVVRAQNVQITFQRKTFVLLSS